MEKTFLPIVRPEKRESFLEQWQDWLVLSNDVEEQKLPGKLKPEFSSLDAEMIALAPKSYICHDFSKNSNKIGKKGIPLIVPLELDEFRDVLYSNLEHFVDVKSLRLNRDKEMVRTSTRKKGLSSITVKLRVGQDLINCHPLVDRANKFL